MASPALIIPSHYYVCNAGGGVRTPDHPSGPSRISARMQDNHLQLTFAKAELLVFPFITTLTTNLLFKISESWLMINCPFSDHGASSPVVLLCLVQKQQAILIPAFHLAAGTNHGDLPQPPKHCHRRGEPSLPSKSSQRPNSSKSTCTSSHLPSYWYPSSLSLQALHC